MKPAGLLPFVLLFIFTSCTAKYIIKPNDLKDVTSLKQLSEKEEAVVILKSGKEIDAKNIIIAPDSTSLINSETKKLDSYQTESILKIIFTDSWQGAKDGFTVGFIMGAIPGMIAGLPNDKLGPVAGALVLGGTFGLAGGLSGTVLGAIIGSEKVYYIKNPGK